MKNKLTSKAILSAVIAIMICYAYYNFYLVGQIEGITILKQSIENKKQEIKAYAMKADTIDSDIQKIIIKNEENDNKIPDQHNKKVIIESFYNLIKNSRLQGSTINISEPNSNFSKYNKVSAEFTLRGDYEDIKEFIRTLEYNQRKYTIKQCTVSKSEISSVSLVVEIYSL